jgi:hypothetical protein
MGDPSMSVATRDDALVSWLAANSSMRRQTVWPVESDSLWEAWDSSDPVDRTEAALDSAFAALSL